MAAPTTHLTVTLLLALVFRPMSWLEWSLAIFWGTLIDVDHFFSETFVRDFPGRIKRMLRGEDSAPPKESAQPIGWLHIAPGYFFMVLWPFSYLFGVESRLIWLPLFFWASHILVDYGEKLPNGYRHYNPLYPLFKKSWIPKWGYPSKTANEVIIGTTCAVILTAWHMSG